MNIINIPTSKDIYIEVNGKKIAVAQSYTAKTSKESRYIEAFGSTEPVGTVEGKVKHTLELMRVVLSCEEIDEPDFYSLTDFNVVIVNKAGKIIYSGCNWAEITRGLELGSTIAEKVKIVAARRLSA